LPSRRRSGQPSGAPSESSKASGRCLSRTAGLGLPGKRDGAGSVGGRLPGGAGKAAGACRPAGGRACRTVTPAPRSCIAVGSRRSRAPAAKPVSAPPGRLSADRCTTTRVSSTRDLMPILRNISSSMTTSRRPRKSDRSARAYADPRARGRPARSPPEMPAAASTHSRASTIEQPSTARKLPT
jgi:hypothetical protein